MPAYATAARFARMAARLVVFALAAGLGSPLAPARADSGTIEVDDLSFDIGYARYSAKHLELTGSKLSGAEFKELLSSLSPESLTKLDADSIVIPDLELNQDVAGMHQVAHYRGVKLEGIRSGRVSAYSIDGATMGGEMAPGQAMQGTMGRMGGTDIDLPGLARIFSLANPDGSAQKALLYGTAYSDGFEVKMPMLEMRVGKTEMSGIRGRPLKTALSEIMKQIPKPPEPGQPPRPQDQQAAIAFLSSFLDFYDAFAIGKLEMHDLKLSVHANPDQAAGFSLTDVSVTDYADSRVGEMALTGLDVLAPNGKMHLGAVALSGFDFREALAGLMSFTQKLAAGPPGTPPSQDDLKLLKLPRLQAFSLAGLSIDAAAPNNRNNPQLEDTPVHASLAGFEVKPELWSDGLPKSVAAKLDHFVFKLPPNSPSFAALAAGGVDTIDFSAGFDGQWDEPAQRLTINSGRLEYHGLGSLNFSAAAENVPPEAFSSDHFAAEAAWFGALLKSVELSIDNHGMIEVMLKAEAKQTGQPIDQMRGSMIEGAAIGLPALLGDSPAAKKLVDAVTKFLANPKNLRISAKSGGGVGAADMVAPDHILDKVDLAATANQ